MMQIPEYFLHKAARQFGDVGPGWVRVLPSLLARCQDRWQLTDCIPADNLSINLICYARSAMYGDVVLKIDGPHNERLTEIAALQLYAGRGACKCLEAGREIAAMLLERIIPGHNLKTLPDKKRQLEIGAELITRLPIPVCEAHKFPTYNNWVTEAIVMTQANDDLDARMFPLMAATEKMFREICSGDPTQVKCTPIKLSVYPFLVLAYTCLEIVRRHQGNQKNETFAQKCPSLVTCNEPYPADPTRPGGVPNT